MIDDTYTGFIEVDTFDDEDAGYGTCSSGAQSINSVVSSPQEYLIENGRRYHSYYGPDKNLMPTDETEHERLDIHHEIMLHIAEGEIYKAPLINPGRALDLGTGSGLWSVDFASKHPECEVIGVDLSPFQPNWAPPNCRFEVDDFELEWIYEKESFDFIHARNITHSVKDWADLLPRVMRHLKPGAWFELSELGSVIYSDDNTLPDDWTPKLIWDLQREALNKLGRIVPSGEWLEQLLPAAGFVDVEVKTFKQPLMAWPKQKHLKQAGALITMAADDTYEAYNLSLLTRALRWTTADAKALCQAAAAAHHERRSKVHAYSKFFVAYGRKPWN